VLAKRFLLASLCEHLIRAHGLQVLLLGNTPWDVSTLWTVFDLLDDALKERVAVPDTSAWRAGQLKRAISRCRLAFGGRYHFVVFAATANVPVVGHCGNHYSYIKQDGFARPVGLERFILNERASCDRESIQARLADALQYKPSLEGRFKRPGESMLRFGQWLQSLPRTGRY
jgi:polysaccharide pyruvyl transferase WcaK-like protein